METKERYESLFMQSPEIVTTTHNRANIVMEFLTIRSDFFPVHYPLTRNLTDSI